MRKILLISHGLLAQGMQQTLSFFLGETLPVRAISAYLEDQRLQDQIDQAMAWVQPEDELLIFSDLNEGSVNQQMLPYLSRPQTYLIAGMNLPLLLKATSFPQQERLDEQRIHERLRQGQQGMVYVNEVFRQIQMSEEDE